MATANNFQYQLAQVDAVFKKKYDPRKVSNLTFAQNKLLGTVNKKTGFTGKSYEIPVTLANAAGGSATFSDAVTSRRSTQHERWSLTRVRAYQTVTIDRESMRAAKDDAGAFLRATSSQVDSMFRAHGADVNWNLYRDNTGLRGVVASVTGAVVTLDAGYVRAFEQGMRITVYDSTDAADYSAATPNVASARVVAVNRAANTITLDSDLSASIAADDVIVRAGDEYGKLSGLASWVPATVTSDLFFGVDRTQYPERLAGLIYTPGAAENYDVSLRTAAASVIENEGDPTHIFGNPLDIAQLDIDLDGDREFDKARSADGNVGYDVIKIHCGGPIVTVHSDAWCPRDQMWMLSMDSVELLSIDPFGTIAEDGNLLHRLEEEDAFEARAAFYGQFSLARAPGHNIKVNLNHP
jgi:hypothetical protein